MQRSLALALVGFACGGSAPPAARPAPQVVAPAALQARAPTRPADTLYRSEVMRFIDAGFWNFLQHVEVEPSLSEGRFRGWVIVALRPSDFWHDVDLAPGDVVTSVNDLPIERETEAFDAFQSLRTASTLRVSYLRRGAERRLAYRIAE